MRVKTCRQEGSSLSNLAVGIGIGTALAYFGDSRSGRRRRSALRNQLAHAAANSTKSLDVAVRDLRHRAYGVWAEIRGSIAERSVPDRILIARVRSSLGRYVAHPSLIAVGAHDGFVVLQGLVLNHERDALISAVRSVRGVRCVEDQLEAHDDHDELPELQGGQSRLGESTASMQENWSPAVRLMAGGTGCALMVNCAARRTPSAILLGTLGFGLLLRAAANMAPRRLFGLDSTRRGIDFHKTITINASPETVFLFLNDIENHARFSDSVTRVRQVSEGRYEKHVRGPFGTDVRLDEIITRSIPNEELSWKSGPNSELTYAGMARLEPTEDGGTRVDLKFTYNPPGGILSHAAAYMTGCDPKTFFDDAFMRTKSYLESVERSPSG